MLARKSVDKLRTPKTGWFGVPGENNNGRKPIDFCADKGLSLSSAYLEHTSLRKYTRVARHQGGVEVMNITDLALVKKDCYTMFRM